LNFVGDPKAWVCYKIICCSNKSLKDDLIDVLVTAPINIIYSRRISNSWSYRLFGSRTRGCSYAYGSG
jgi:hypothetical protein